MSESSAFVVRSGHCFLQLISWCYFQMADLASHTLQKILRPIPLLIIFFVAICFLFVSFQDEKTTLTEISPTVFRSWQKPRRDEIDLQGEQQQILSNLMFADNLCPLGPAGPKLPSSQLGSHLSSVLALCGDLCDLCKPVRVQPGQFMGTVKAQVGRWSEGGRKVVKR